MKFLFSILSGLLLVTIFTSACSSENLAQKTAPSVHKVVIFRNSESVMPMAFATSFFIKTNSGRIIGVTNDHVCLMMIGHDSYLRRVDGYLSLDYNDRNEALKVKDVSLSMGDDVCFFTVHGRSPRHYLRLGDDSPKLGHITIVGYVEENPDILAENGYISSSVEFQEPSRFLKCPAFPPTKLNRIMCSLFGRSFSYSNSTQDQITTRVGPGFSGSPVLNEFGEVIGILARYAPPRSDYTEEQGFIIPVSTIKRQLERIHLVSVKNSKLKKFAIMMSVSNKINDYLQEQKQYEEYFIQSTVKEVINESSSH